MIAHCIDCARPVQAVTYLPEPRCTEHAIAFWRGAALYTRLMRIVPRGPLPLGILPYSPSPVKADRVYVLNVAVD